MSLPSVINQLINQQDLTAAVMRETMSSIMTGQATDAQIAAFLVALRIKGETVEEIAAAAEVMRSLASQVPVSSPVTVDTCGTGGDGAGIFNVSTGSAFIVAAAGGKVAKHGNRSVTSKSGSADLLEAAGVNLDLTPAEVARAIDEVGVGFMFAVKHHGAMRHAIGPRREIAVRTIFNLLGPITNPANCKHQVLGVYDKKWVRPLAEVLQKLGSRHVLVVHAEDGLDEFSIAAPSFVAELKNGQISEYQVTPEQFGFVRGSLQEIVVDSAAQSLALIKKAFAEPDCVAGRILALNAGAAIYAADLVDSFQAGVDLAKQMMHSGQALAKMQQFIDFTRSIKAESFEE